MKKACAIAREIMRQHKVKTVQTTAKSADSALLEIAKSGIAVITSDRELKRRIKKALGEIIELSTGHLKLS